MNSPRIILLFGMVALSARAATEVRSVVVSGDPMPSGGNFVALLEPTIFPSGQISFQNAVSPIVGVPGNFVLLNANASTITGLTLKSGESIKPIPAIISSSTAGHYFVRVTLDSAFPASTALLYGTPGAFTKILRTGDLLPGTTAVWDKYRFFGTGSYLPIP